MFFERREHPLQNLAYIYSVKLCSPGRAVLLNKKHDMFLSINYNELGCSDYIYGLAIQQITKKNSCSIHLFTKYFLLLGSDKYFKL